MSDRFIGEKLLSDVTGRFFVPDYQRGYRWSAPQVDRLLDDLALFMAERKKGAPASRYFLQPIVIKKSAGTTYDYELIDGQQRLTTIYLIYAYLKRENIKPLVPQRYSFVFDANARPESSEFMGNLSLAMLANDAEFERNIDFFHMAQAYKRVAAWLERQGDKAARAVDALYEALEEHVRIIWYEIPPHEDGNRLFTRLNMGKIPLTNAELVKAWLMSPDSVRAGSPEELRMRQTMLAMQWDSMERRLRDDAFWYFITKEDPRLFEPRMDLLFSMLAGTEKEQDTYTIFFKLNRAYTDNPSALWEKVLLYYQVLSNWNEDKRAYHRIGYLFATGESPRKLIDSQGELTKDAFESYVDEAIRNKVRLPDRKNLEDLDFEKNYPLLRNILLLFNVHSSMDTTNPLERYPFVFHNDVRRSWSLEHIHARNVEELTTEQQWRDWLHYHYTALTKHSSPQEGDAKVEVSRSIASLLENKISKEDFGSIAPKVLSLFEEHDPEDGDWINGISNLALLDRDTNSALNKAVFVVKRERLLNRYKEGAYIPLCTLRAFMRFYSKDGDSTSNPEWTREDRQSYLAAIKNVYSLYAVENCPEAV